MAVTEGEFAYFQLRGQRFNAPGMPVAAFAEVVAFQELVIDVARRLWLAANPKRQRVPRGFFESLDLRVSEVRDGSAVPVLERYRSGLATVDLNLDDYFSTSRDIITGAISSVRTTESLTSEFPPGSLPKLRNLGRTLGAGEYLTLGHPADRNRRAELSQAVRETIRRIDEQTASEVVIQLAGLIVEFDVDNSTFQLRTGDNHRVVCPFDAGQARDVHNLMALANDEDALVTVRGRALVDGNGVVQRFTEPVKVESVPVNAMVLILQRLTSLLSRAGSDPYAPEEPNHQAINFLRLRVAEDLARLYPNVAFADLPDGSIRIEFVREGIEHVAELEPSNSMYLFRYDPNTGIDAERDVETYDLEILRDFLGGVDVF